MHFQITLLYEIDIIREKEQLIMCASQVILCYYNFFHHSLMFTLILYYDAILFRYIVVDYFAILCIMYTYT